MKDKTLRIVGIVVIAATAIFFIYHTPTTTCPCKCEVKNETGFLVIRNKLKNLMLNIYFYVIVYT
jgi:hypothetical protein